MAMVANDIVEGAGRGLQCRATASMSAAAIPGQVAAVADALKFQHNAPPA